MRNLPNAVGPRCATPLPGRDAATDHGVAGLSVALGTGTLVPPAGPTCASLLSPQGGMWRATFGGVNRYPNNSANRADALGARALSGVARRRRTLIAPAQIAYLRGKAAWLGRTTESHGPTDVLRPYGYEGPDSGGCVRTHTPATGYPTTSRPPGGVVNASSILGAR